MFPSKVIGFALNSKNASEFEAEKVRARIKEKHCLLVCDVLREGSDELVEAILNYKEKIIPA
ncbi:MAG: hypothetical protein A2254_13115 [Ignavibacteria bacterium RIFOXYA2_FULL_35_9]|nr:MAG: hypothetical protein A2254_13115 [Ignavibacteria bacterium RIFOXYA2_FULL_35_9]